MTEVTTGSLLIAEPFMKDPNFMRNVVLICRHHAEDGCFGFVLSHAIEFTTNQLVEELADVALPVYDGGPVSKDTLHFLHQFPNQIPESAAVGNGIYWGGDFEALKEGLHNGSLDAEKVKFFVGYSGWDADQMQDELKEGNWIVMPATPRLVFETKPADLWKVCLGTLGGDYKQMIHFPTDPQLN